MKNIFIVFVILTSFYSASAQVIFSGNQTVNSQILANGAIIKSGSIVVFNGTFTITQGGRIFIEQNAFLSIENATLQGANWQGIIMQSLTISNMYTCGSTGVSVKNSTIKDALIGIINVDLSQPKQDLDYAGGMVHIENSIF